jgi:hypothetical protein
LKDCTLPPHFILQILSIYAVPLEISKAGIFRAEVRQVPVLFFTTSNFEMRVYLFMAIVWAKAQRWFGAFNPVLKDGVINNSAVHGGD